MNFLKIIQYDSKNMTLRIGTDKHYLYFQCPFATWWKARKFFVKPKFKFYFGRTCKQNGYIETEKFGKTENWETYGLWPAVSTEFLKWNLSKNKFIRFFQKLFPISIYSYDILWKDKWNSPRYERPGYFVIFFGRDYRTCWQFSFTVIAPTVYCNNNCEDIAMDENYWETILDYLYYTDYKNKELSDFDRLLKCRKYLQKFHWHKTKSIDIPEDSYEITEINNTIFKDINYLTITYNSEKIINCCNTKTPAFNTSTDFMLIINTDDKKHYLHSDYIEYIDKNIIKIYYKLYDKKYNLYDILTNKQYNLLELSKCYYIDLGPTFKDEFLNEKTQLKIREILKK